MLTDTLGAQVVVVAPIFNDWACLEPLLASWHHFEASHRGTRFVIVDDGSTDHLPHIDSARALPQVEVVRLGTNVGHQRAIAVGLSTLDQLPDDAVVVVMDSDGEDRPEAFTELWSAHLQNPSAVIVAQRRHRTEAVNFRIFYRAYRGLFRALTGRKLDFGNYVLLPAPAVQRLVLMNELWNHFPAAVMRSRLPVVKVPIDRGVRYAGRSRMNFTALVNHGLAAIAAFIDAVFVRLLVVTGVLLGSTALAGCAVVAVRLWGAWGVPGWATTALGIVALALLQLLGLLVVITFLTLSLRSSASPPPASFARQYISKVETIS